MTPSEFAALRDRTKANEGTGPMKNGRHFPYQDTVGKTTIGYGRNLTDVGISGAEASAMLDHDLETAVAELTQAYPIVLTLAPARQIVLAELAFNLGMPRLSRFTHMWANILSGNFAQAAAELLDSDAARQLPSRYGRLAEELKTGELRA